MDQLLRRHYDRIHAVCRRIAGGARDADDAAQEAMIRIVRSLDKFDGRSAFGTWAYRIATNAALDELRRRKRRPQLHVVHDADDGPAADRIDERAQRDVDAIADRMAIDAALAALPEEFRTPSCCATSATSTTPRSPRRSTSRSVPSNRASPAVAGCWSPTSGTARPPPSVLRGEHPNEP